jgi:hypothetical protein
MAAVEFTDNPRAGRKGEASGSSSLEHGCRGKTEALIRWRTEKDIVVVNANPAATTTYPCKNQSHVHSAKKELLVLSHHTSPDRSLKHPLEIE